MLRFFKLSNLLYVKNKYKKLFFRKLFQFKNININYNSNNYHFYFKNDKNIKLSSAPVAISITDALKNDFYLNSDIDSYFRANDFFNLLDKALDTKEVIGFLNDWKNRFFEDDIFYKYPLENSIRLNHLIWYMQLKFGSISKEEKELLTRMIIHLANYCLNNIEIHLNNNHTLIESKNLLIASLFYQDNKYSKKWQEKSLKILHKCLETQIDDNGVHIERSTMYQKVILSELIELHNALLNCKNQIGEEFLKTFKEKLSLMCEYDNIMTYKDGYFPLWGDGYMDDRLFKLIPKGMINEKRKEFWENLLVLPLVCEGIENKNFFEDYSGFIFINHSKYSFIFNAGSAFSKQKFAKGHLHSDILGFVVFHNDKELIINAGTLNYSKNSIHYFRGVRGHNTVMINKKEQHGFLDESKGQQFADGKYDITLNDEMNKISSSHNGYSNQNVKHYRKVEFHEGSDILKIYDTILGDEYINDFEYYMHFAPEIECTLDNNILSIRNICSIKFNIGSNNEISLLNRDVYEGATRSIFINESQNSKVLRIKGSFKNQVVLKSSFRFL